VNIKASDALYVIIAHKLKKSLSSVDPSSTIKELVGGKSALQNEILGDLGAEFGDALADKSEELPLTELVTRIEPSFSGNLGKVTAGLVSKTVSSKMPGGFGISQIRDYCYMTFGFGPKRTDALMLLSILEEPPTRIPDEPRAKKWITTVANAYAKQANISLHSSSDSTSATSGGSVTSSGDFLKLQDRLQALFRSELESRAKYLDFDLFHNNSIQESMDKFTAEHGEVYQSGVAPLFDVRKVRDYSSYWNWYC
jgi:fatty acid synthase subunit alpha, fungi type